MAKSFDDLIKNVSEAKPKKSKITSLIGSKDDIINFIIYIVLFGIGFGIIIVFLFAASNHPTHTLLRGEIGDELSGMHGPSDFIELINNPANLLQSSL
jgi:hypothetical protein